MQEDIENRTMNLCIASTKLTARLVIMAWRKLHAMEKEQKAAEKAAEEAPKQGKQTVKELIKQGQGVTDVEISKTGIRDFERIARKYGVDFAIKKSRTTPPKYLVFFKAKDADALNAAMNEYASRSLKKDERPSVLQTLKKLKEIVAQLPGKIRNKEQVR